MNKLVRTRKFKQKPEQYSDLDTYIGLKVREKRNDLGISQEVLGHKINISFQQVQKYEKGLNQFTVRRLLQLCEALEVPIYCFIENYIDIKGHVYIEGYSKKEDRLEKSLNITDGRHSENSNRDTIALVKHFNNIPSKELRLLILDHVRQLEKALTIDKA